MDEADGLFNLKFFAMKIYDEFFLNQLKIICIQKDLVYI